MERVKFAKEFNFRKDRRTMVNYPAGFEGEVTNEAAQAAREGGYLDEVRPARTADAEAGTSREGTATQAKGVKG